jgi:hypothetical protein
MQEWEEVMSLVIVQEERGRRGRKNKQKRRGRRNFDEAMGTRSFTQWACVY